MFTPDSKRIHLKRGMFFHVREGAGKVITAHAGLVWITEQDSPCDVVLRPGESFVLVGRGLALVEAVRDASISLRAAGPTRRLPL